MHIVWYFCLSYVLSYHMVRQLTSVWYSGVGFRISNLNFTVPWFITRLWNHFEICTEHDNFEIWYTCSSYLCRKSFAIRFSKSLLFIFSRFYVWKFRVNVSFNIVSRRIYSGTLRVETSRCRCRISLPGKHANIARSWDFFPKYASSTHLKSKTNAYIHIYVWYKYPLKQNCHIFRPIRCEEHVVWQPALSLCAIPFNCIPPLVSCISRWGMPELRCPRNDSLDNDDTEKSLRLSTLHKWNQQIWHQSRTPIFLSFLSAVDRKSVRIYCAQRRLFTVSVSLSAAWK